MVETNTNLARSGSGLNRRLLPLLALGLLSFYMVVHTYHITESATPTANPLKDFASIDNPKRPSIDSRGTPPSASEQQGHRVAGLSCPAVPKHLLNETRYKQAQQEIVYWKDIPKDSYIMSPYKCPNQKVKKFLTFERELHCENVPYLHHKPMVKSLIQRCLFDFPNDSG